MSDNDAKQFELTKTFKFADKDDYAECTFITLDSPSSKVAHLCAPIHALAQESMMKMTSLLDDETIKNHKSNSEPDNNDEPDDGEAMMTAIMGGGCDMAKMVLLFKDLFQVVGLMNGEKKLTSVRIDDMSYQDFKNMMGVYIANFILS